MDRLGKYREKLPSFTFATDYINGTGQDKSGEVISDWDLCSDDLTGSQLAHGLKTYYNLSRTQGGVSQFSRKETPVFR